MVVVVEEDKTWSEVGRRKSEMWTPMTGEKSARWRWTSFAELVSCRCCWRWMSMEEKIGKTLTKKMSYLPSTGLLSFSGQKKFVCSLSCFLKNFRTPSTFHTILHSLTSSSSVSSSLRQLPGSRGCRAGKVISNACRELGWGWVGKGTCVVRGEERRGTLHFDAAPGTTFTPHPASPWRRLTCRSRCAAVKGGCTDSTLVRHLTAKVSKMLHSDLTRMKRKTMKQQEWR